MMIQTKQSKIKISLLLTFILIGFSPTSKAQEFFSELAAPPSPPKTILRFSSSTEPPIQGDRDSSKIENQRFFVSTPINKPMSDPASVSWKWSQNSLSGQPILPSGARVPNYLYESEYGLSYRHFADQSSFTGLTMNYGSASDKPFSSGSSSVFGFTAFHSTTDNPTQRWVWLVNYSNNRSFANGIPLPGFAYIYSPSKESLTVLGFPFVFGRYQLSEDWRLQALVGPYVYRLEFSKTLFGPYQAYWLNDSTLMNFFREGREKKEDRLFISESKSTLGLRGPLSQILFLDLNAGLAYARSISESENYKSNKADHLLLENRWFLSGALSARF